MIFLLQLSAPGLPYSTSAVKDWNCSRWENYSQAARRSFEDPLCACFITCPFTRHESTYVCRTLLCASTSVHCQPRPASLPHLFFEQFRLLNNSACVYQSYLERSHCEKEYTVEGSRGSNVMGFSTHRERGGGVGLSDTGTTPPPAVLKITSSLSIWLTRQTGALGEYYLTGVCSTARQTDSHTHTCKHTHTYTHTNISLSNY